MSLGSQDLTANLLMWLHCEKKKKKPKKKRNLEYSWKDSSLKFKKKGEEKMNSNIGECFTSWIMVVYDEKTFILQMNKSHVL